MANYTGYKNKTLGKKNTYYVGLYLDNGELQTIDFTFDKIDIESASQILSFEISENELYNCILLVKSNGDIFLTDANDNYWIKLSEGSFTKIQKTCYVEGYFYKGQIDIDPMSSNFVLDSGIGTPGGDAYKSYRLDNIGDDESLSLLIINISERNAKILITKV